MHLTLHLTTACNMQCDYCYSPPSAGPAMTVDVGREAMLLGARMTDGSCGIVFFGGEPLLQVQLIRDLVKFGRDLERGRNGRFHFKVTTNGLLLNEEFLEFSLRENLLVAMSFDGIREAHDQHRTLADGSPTFDGLLPRLEMLLEARPYSAIITVVNPDTAQFLSKSVSFLLTAGCRYLIVSPNYAAPWDQHSLGVLGKQLAELGDLYIEWTLQGRKFYLSPFEVKISSHVNKHCFQKERCELAQRQVSVDPQGNLFPCVQFTKAGPNSVWCIGNTGTGIDEARRSRIQHESERAKAPCTYCVIADRCNNSCGCLNWQTTGNINKVSPVLCRYEQMTLAVADKIGKKLYKKRNALFLHKHYNAAYPVLSLLEETRASVTR
ncbi:MAG: radical SAM protein [Planctomycetota bacterium]